MALRDGSSPHTAAILFRMVLQARRRMTRCTSSATPRTMRFLQTDSTLISWCGTPRMKNGSRTTRSNVSASTRPKKRNRLLRGPSSSRRTQGQGARNRPGRAFSVRWPRPSHTSSPERPARRCHQRSRSACSVWREQTSLSPGKIFTRMSSLPSESFWSTASEPTMPPGCTCAGTHRFRGRRASVTSRECSGGAVRSWMPPKPFARRSRRRRRRTSLVRRRASPKRKQCPSR
mmetsp:Transcript_172/g.302  ORF Transcript_172/g.302 Transcript_172/m.302 type:complete len:232 (-) Transcript_172:3504-4199(-)